MKTWETDRLCAEYAASVIRAVLHQRPVPEQLGDLTLHKIYPFVRAHGIEGIVGYGLQSFDHSKDSEIWKEWSERRNLLLVQSITQLSERDQLYELLSKNGIDLLPLKGCWLKQLYPQIDFRQMSDLDLLIHKKDRKRAGELLEQSGYKRQQGLTGYDDAYFKKPYTTVELHYQLFDDTSPVAGYYGNIWERAQQIEADSRIWQMSKEDAYLYQLLHLQRHYYSSGCGMRFLMDMEILRESWVDLRMDYVEEQLSALQLEEFAAQVSALSQYWFGEGQTEIEEWGVEPAFYQRIVRSGLYGTKELQTEQRMQELQKKVHHPAAAKVAYYWKRIFVSMYDMKIMYPVLKKCPLLLSLCWVHRLVQAVRKKPGAVKAELAALKNSDQS